MKVYVVMNGDSVIMGVFDKKSKSEKVIKDIGKDVWNETWDIETIKINQVKSELKTRPEEDWE